MTQTRPFIRWFLKNKNSTGDDRFDRRLRVVTQRSDVLDIFKASQPVRELFLAFALRNPGLRSLKFGDNLLKVGSGAWSFPRQEDYEQQQSDMAQLVAALDRLMGKLPADSTGQTKPRGRLANLVDAQFALLLLWFLLSESWRAEPGVFGTPWELRLLFTSGVLAATTGMVLLLSTDAVLRWRATMKNLGVCFLFLIGPAGPLVDGLNSLHVEGERTLSVEYVKLRKQATGPVPTKYFASIVMPGQIRADVEMSFTRYSEWQKLDPSPGSRVMVTLVKGWLGVEWLTAVKLSGAASP